MKPLVTVLFASLAFASVALATPSVIEGTVAKVVEKKKEIYVSSEGKKYEYYFKADTTLTQGGKPVEFGSLKEGQKVRVSAEKIGRRLDPKSVEILE